MSALASDSSTTVAGAEVSKNKRKGGRIVKSRYLQYNKKVDGKGASANLISKCTAQPSSATKSRSVLPQKCKTSAGVVSSSLNQGSFEEGVLQSTLIDEQKISRLDLDLSAVNDKTVRKKTLGSDTVRKKTLGSDTVRKKTLGSDTARKKTPGSDTACKEDTGTFQKTKKVGDDSDVIEELESQTLLLTYLRLKAGKNLAELEKKAEENLLMLCEEKERQQEKLYELKREILLKERKQKLDDALDKQMEVLSPLVPVCEQFKEQYKSFAVSLDATRHELPIKNIHIEGDMLTYLDELRKQLTITQELLAEVMPSYSEESTKTFSVLKELKEVSQKLDQELQRSFTQVQKLSSEVSKEVSLHNQRICEENHGLDVVKRWYFD